MRHSRFTEHQKDAKALVGAILRDTERRGFNIFRTKDQKLIAQGWEKVTESRDLAERTSRAEAIRACAAFAEKNYRRAHPLRAALTALGLRDKKLEALQQAQAEAGALIERAKPALAQIESQTFGGGAKLRERFARELADGASLDRSARALAEEWRLRAETLGPGLERDRAHQAADHLDSALRVRLREAAKDRDLARFTEEAIKVRRELQQFANDLELVGAKLPPMPELRAPGGSARADLVQGRAAEVRAHALATLDRMEQEARKWEARTDRDPDAGRRMVELRTNRERLRDALARGDDEAVVRAGNRAADQLLDSEKALAAPERSERSEREYTGPSMELAR